MKLWLLRPADGLYGVNNPWGGVYLWDKAKGFVVRAETEEAARYVANNNAGDENDEVINPWLDGKYSTCVELTSDGEEGLILRDYFNG